MLCACRQHAESQHWSHRSPPGGAGAIACEPCALATRRAGAGLRIAAALAPHLHATLVQVGGLVNNLATAAVATPSLQGDQKSGNQIR